MTGSLRALLRQQADARAWAEVLCWFNDQPAARSWTLAEIEPHTQLQIEALLRLLNGWQERGWVESTQDSGRTLWRATSAMPAVSRTERPEREALGDWFSALLDVEAR